MRQIPAAVHARGGDLPERAGVTRPLQPIRFCGRRQQAPGLTLLRRSKPQLGQIEVPGMEARQCRAAIAYSRAPRSRPCPRRSGLSKEARELVRVQERLEDADFRPGFARELRKHVTILEREIAELESA